MRGRLGTGLAVLAVALAGCARAPQGTTSGIAGDSLSDAAHIAADRPERLLMPQAPPGPGEMVIERVAPMRAGLELPPAALEFPPPALELPPPPAEPGAEPAAAEAAVELASLKPPIARGLPRVVLGGRGGLVTLDVRVDEHGEVSDVELVESGADSLAVAAALAAASEIRYHPALLGERRVAVWCRQVVHVLRER